LIEKYRGKLICSVFSEISNPILLRQADFGFFSGYWVYGQMLNRRYDFFTNCISDRTLPIFLSSYSANAEASVAGTRFFHRRWAIYQTVPCSQRQAAYSGNKVIHSKHPCFKTIPTYYLKYFYLIETKM